MVLQLQLQHPRPVLRTPSDVIIHRVQLRTYDKRMVFLPSAAWLIRLGVYLCRGSGCNCGWGVLAKLTGIGFHLVVEATALPTLHEPFPHNSRIRSCFVRVLVTCIAPRRLGIISVLPLTTDGPPAAGLVHVSLTVDT